MKKIILIVMILELLTSCAGGTTGTSFAGTSSSGIRTKRGYGSSPRRRVYKPSKSYRYYR